MEGCNEYVYKQEINWSLLTEGITLPVENQVVFGRIMNRYLTKGEQKPIKIFLNGKSYDAKVVNVNFDKKFNRKTDVIQIRYPRNGDLARELQQIFASSYNFFSNARKIRPEGSRSIPKLPEDAKEYLAIYTTEYDDTYEFDTIGATDIEAVKQDVAGKSEYLYEANYDIDMEDTTSTIKEVQGVYKVRKLNCKIGDNLKLLYGYRCQICGQLIGEEYDSHVAEAHHIDYYVNSLNNDASNQMIVCPNHHRIIHDADPVFNRIGLKYVYKNGLEEPLRLNQHL